MEHSNEPHQEGDDGGRVRFTTYITAHHKHLLRIRAAEHGKTPAAFVRQMIEREVAQ